MTDEVTGPLADTDTDTDTETETAAPQRGRPFEPGQSGNPLGRPKGSRNKTTLAVEALLDGEAAAITRKAIDKALEGDIGALRLCLARVVPARRDRPVIFELPTIKTAADGLAASSAVLAACAEGTLSPTEAAEIMALITTHIKALEASELEERRNAWKKRIG